MKSDSLAGQAPGGRLDEITATEARVTELRRTDELVDALTRTDAARGRG